MNSVSASRMSVSFLAVDCPESLGAFGNSPGHLPPLASMNEYSGTYYAGRGSPVAESHPRVVLNR